MRRALVSVVAFVAVMGTPALVRDASASPVDTVPLYSWTGCYGGVHVGGGGSENSSASIIDLEGLGGGNNVGVLGGGQVGCNYQLNRFVIGVEGEFWGSSLSSQSNFTESSAPPINFNSSSRNPWDAAVSARAGLAFDNALVYGKLGVSFGRFEDSFTETDVGTTAMLSGSANYTGVLIGVGFEYALTARWSAKFEFDYINFGTVAVPFTCTGTCTGIGSLTTISTPESEEIAKIGVNYKFW